jgi:integrase/recombinase XerD
VWGVVKKYGALAGVEVTTHHLRHLKARVMLNNGAQLSEVQDILGHASPETTKKIYAPYTKQHLRAAFDRFSLPAEEVARRVRR